MATASEAIQILLKEYDALRSEVNLRGTATFQLIAVSAVGATVCFGRLDKAGKPETLFWLLLLSFVAIVAIFSFLVGRDVQNAAARLIEIEQHVNELAGVQLLCWETRFGGAKRGLFGRKQLDPDTTGQPIKRSDSWQLDPESK